ncbi:MAG: hypothetical protein Q8835_03265 [Sweet potato little leaf phytoplasma]|nr:hypothetical protein [Sweet potato little leaf phytoplasma]
MYDPRYVLKILSLESLAVWPYGQEVILIIFLKTWRYSQDDDFSTYFLKTWWYGHDHRWRYGHNKIFVAIGSRLALRPRNKVILKQSLGSLINVCACITNPGRGVTY